MERIVIDVYGKVQGVFFRYNTKRKAKKLGLEGYAENKPDGSVHIEAQGEKSDLKKLLEFTREGPRLARVENVKYEYKDPIENFDGHRYSF